MVGDVAHGFIRFLKGSIAQNRLSGKNVGPGIKRKSPKSFLAA